MILRRIFLVLFGGSYGFLSAAGVFTVLAAVGLIPRFAGKTHTAKEICLYESMVILGAILGCFVSVFPEKCRIGAWLVQIFPAWERCRRWLGDFCLVLIGLFSGMFVGALALAIAEMLDSIPIFARRVSYQRLFAQRGLTVAITAVAVGKCIGSLFYFWAEIYQTGG